MLELTEEWRCCAEAEHDLPVQYEIGRPKALLISSFSSLAAGEIVAHSWSPPHVPIVPCPRLSGQRGLFGMQGRLHPWRSRAAAPLRPPLPQGLRAAVAHPGVPPHPAISPGLVFVAV